MPLYKHSLSLILITILLSIAFPVITIPSTVEAADAWTSMTSGTTEQLNSVWGSSCSNVFAVGNNGTILRYNGSTWNAMTSGTSMGLTGVWGSSSTNVFAVGWSGTILHWDGSTWTAMSSGTTNDLYAVWGNAANSAFAVGGMQTIRYWNGSTWTAMTTPGLESAFYAVWGTAYNNVYTVGSDGDIYHFDGTSWTLQASGTNATLYAIWGSSSSDIWAVGAATAQTRYNGSVWNSLTIHPLMVSYTSLWGTSASNIYMSCKYVMGDSGAVKYYDGSSWSSVTIPDCPSLYGIWGSSSFDIFVVGDSGTILHYGGCGLKIASVGTNLGTVNFSIDDGSISNLTHLKVTNTKCSTPAGYDFPYGLFSFKISDLNPGQTVQVTIKFPRYLPLDVKYYKCINGKMVDCTRIMTRLNGYTLVLSPTDGGLGDSDGLANGTIVDPGGPVAPVAAAQVYGQGTIPAVTQQSPVALPAISVKSASLSATKVTPGTPVIITADVANTGTSNGTTSIKVYVNGQEESSQGVTVSSGSSTPLTFTVSRNEPGTYTVYVGGTNAGSFTVDWLADSSIIIISVAAILFAFAIGVIYMTRRKQQAH